ncbi:MAG: flavodoxin family protein [Ilumatobacteraceae bacterium]
MKAALLIESLTGNTRRAGELIAADLQQVGWQVTGSSPVKQPDYASIQDADMIIIGTWVHGLFVVGQAPWGVPLISQLPTMQGKKAAVFCTFALSPGRSLDKLTSVVSQLGAEVIGGLALNRGKLEAHSEEFVTRLVENAPALSPR